MSRIEELETELVEMEGKVQKAVERIFKTIRCEVETPEFASDLLVWAMETEWQARKGFHVGLVLEPPPSQIGKYGSCGHP